MKVLILGICHEIFFFGKKRSKIRVRIIHRRALYTGKYGTKKRPTEVLFGLPNHPRVSCVSQNCNKDLEAAESGLNREL